MGINKKIKYLILAQVLAGGMPFLVGCQQTAVPDFVEVTISGSPYHDGPFLKIGESARITDPVIVQKLASFFPGMGTGRIGFNAVSLSADTFFLFKTGIGKTIRVSTIGYDLWGSDVDRGDLPVEGDLRDYLYALFTSVKVESSSITPFQPIRKIVRIGDEVQKKDGVEYHRIAILYDDTLFERIDSTRDVWFFNGKALWDVTLHEATLLGQYKYRNILIAWFHLPEKGELEVLGGTLLASGIKPNPADDYKALLAAGVKPFRIDVKDIPTIQVKSLDDLPKALGLP